MSIWAHGLNTFATAGLGDWVAHTSGPELQPAGIDFTQMSANGAHVAAIDAAGNLYVFGANIFHALGTGETTFDGPGYTMHLSPYLITQSGISNIVEVACTQRATFARRNDGVIFFAGNNDFGQAGEGAVGIDFTESGPSLYASFTALTTWSSYSVVKMIPGYAAIAMLLSDGTLRFAGANTQGEGGDGTSGTNITTPTQWSAFTNIVDASLSGSDLIALRRNGEIWGSGDNFYGTLMDGSTTDRTSPVQCTSAPANPASVRVLDVTSYVIDTSGRVYAAGRNSDGQISNDGVGDGSAHAAPVEIVIGVKRFRKVVGAPSAEDHYALLTTDGLLYAVGGNTLANGRPIDNSGTNKFQYTQVWPGVITRPISDAVSPGSGEGVFLARTSRGRSWVFVVG